MSINVIEQVNRSFLLMFIAIIATTLFSPFFIAILYKTNQVSGIKPTKLSNGNGSNSLFMKIMNSNITNGTPNMGGIIIWILAPILIYLLLPHTSFTKVFLLGFVLEGLWGAIDQVFSNSIKNNGRLKAIQETFEWRLGKLILTILLNVGVIYIAQQNNLLPSTIKLTNLLTFSTAGIICAFALGILMDFAVYSADLIDGLDGLMIGSFFIMFSGLGFLLFIQGQLSFLPYIAIILGILIVDLYFNIHPARFWNGGPGAMPLGFTLFFIALLTNNLVPYFVISIFTWLDMFSSAIQIISLRFLKKRIFKIAPFHHHLQAIGWEHTKVVMRLWLFVLVTTIIGIWLGLMQL